MSTKTNSPVPERDQPPDTKAAHAQRSGLRPKQTRTEEPTDRRSPEQAKGYGARLARRGWTIQSIVHQGRTVFTALDSFIPDWHSMDWAEQVYHQAKHRFDSNGILSIAADELTGNDPLLRRAIRTSSLQQNGYPLPGSPVPGSNERLKELLEKTRITLDYDSQNDTALIHTGPDGSIIVTNQVGWSPATVENLREYTLSEHQHCPWEHNRGTDPGPMPDWALPISNMPLPRITTPQA